MIIKLLPLNLIRFILHVRSDCEENFLPTGIIRVIFAIIGQKSENAIFNQQHPTFFNGNRLSDGDMIISSGTVTINI